MSSSWGIVSHSTDLYMTEFRMRALARPPPASPSRAGSPLPSSRCPLDRQIYFWNVEEGEKVGPWVSHNCDRTLENRSRCHQLEIDICRDSDVQALVHAVFLILRPYLLKFGGGAL